MRNSFCTCRILKELFPWGVRACWSENDSLRKLEICACCCELQISVASSELYHDLSLTLEAPAFPLQPVSAWPSLTQHCLFCDWLAMLQLSTTQIYAKCLLQKCNLFHVPRFKIFHQNVLLYQ